MDRIWWKGQDRVNALGEDLFALAQARRIFIGVRGKSVAAPDEAAQRSEK
jgi:hypothetical protein